MLRTTLFRSIWKAHCTAVGLWRLTLRTQRHRHSAGTIRTESPELSSQTLVEITSLPRKMPTATTWAGRDLMAELLWSSIFRSMIRRLRQPTHRQPPQTFSTQTTSFMMCFINTDSTKQPATSSLTITATGASEATRYKRILKTDQAPITQTLQRRQTDSLRGCSSSYSTLRTRIETAPSQMRSSTTSMVTESLIA